MASPNKIKGNNFEREVGNDARAWGLEAERAYASNGKSLGYHEEVDCTIGSEVNRYTVQCKRRKKLASFLKCDNADIVAFREDRGGTYMLIPIGTFLTLMKKLEG